MYARLAPSMHRTIGKYAYWPQGTNPRARRIAAVEFNRLREAERKAEEERSAREVARWAEVARQRRAQKQARARANFNNAMSNMRGGTSAPRRKYGPPPRAQSCYWATAHGMGGGRYRVCRSL